MLDKIAPRVALGNTLTKLAKKDSNILVLDADLASSIKIEGFKKALPKQFLEMGIAEQNMIGVAAGLSTVGFIPFVSSFAVFASRRVCDQVVTSVAYPKLNVKIVGAYVGLFVGMNGATHQSLEDVAIMRSIPNMAVIEPVDGLETEEVVKFAVNYNGPIYLRIGRDVMPSIVPSDYKFQLGKSVTIKDGSDITIISCGAIFDEVLSAALLLEKEGISVRIINMSSIKPIDEKVIIKAAQETGKIITVENHNIIGGLGSAVAEVLSEKRPVKLKRIGIRDVFGKSGTNEEMKKKFELRAEDIAEKAKGFVSNS